MQPFVIFLHLLLKHKNYQMKKGLLILLTIIMVTSFSNTAKATHVIGGDLSIRWVSQNNYRLKLRFYRDDITGLVAMPGTMTVTVYDQVTNATITNQVLTQTSLGIVNLGDSCYTPDPNVVRIEEGVYESAVDLFLADNPNGYYLSATENARNALSTNVPANGTMVWLALMADPAIGQNSSPDFGNYPADAYFCVNSPKVIEYPITDADGDSLAYSFTDPLDTPTQPTYPYYGTLGWSAGYSLANSIGGITPMTIDPTTGVIIGAPAIIDFFTFAVRVEEFRDTSAAQNGPKVKIGETRRDIQYQSQNCTGGTPPTFANAYPVNAQTVQIEYNKEYCKDLIFRDANATDTLYLEFLSTIFDSGAYLATVPPDGAGDLHYYYNNGVAPLNVPNDSVVIPPNQSDSVGTFNTGTIANRFCWTPSCSTIGQVYPFQVNAFSLGCDGKSQDSIIFNIEVIEPPINLINPGNVGIRHGVEHCTNIVHHDPNIVDAMQIEIFSDILLLGAEIPSVPTNFSYNNTVYTGNNSSIVTNVSNGAPSAVNTATRLCWVPACEQVGGTYDIQAVISSVDCASPGLKDTINFSYTIIPPFDSAGVVSNVFSPNGDGINDFYTLGYTNEDGERVGGVSNPCNDEVKVQIFNRWGALVFENNDFPEFQWDGTNKGGGKVSPGTYFVVITGTYGSETITLGQRSITVLE